MIAREVKSNPVQVRFQPADQIRLRRLAKRLRMPVSALVRRAIHERMDDWEKNGITLR